MTSTSNESQRIAELEAEVDRLRTENADLKEENMLLIDERDAYNEGDYIEAVDAHQRLFTLDVEQIRKDKDKQIADLQADLDKKYKLFKFIHSKYKEAVYALDTVNKSLEAITDSCVKTLGVDNNYFKYSHHINQLYGGHFARYMHNSFVALMNVNKININTIHTVYKNKKNNGRPYRLKKAMYRVNLYLEAFMNNEDTRCKAVVDYYKIKADTTNFYNLVEGNPHKCENIDKAYIMYSDYDRIDSIFQEFSDSLERERSTYDTDDTMITNLKRFDQLGRWGVSNDYFDEYPPITFTAIPSSCTEIMNNWLGGDFMMSKDCLGAMGRE